MTIIALKGAIRDFFFIFFFFLQSHYLQQIRSSSEGAILCKSRASTLDAFHAQRVMCHVVRRDSTAIKFDRVEIAYILA